MKRIALVAAGLVAAASFAAPAAAVPPVCETHTPLAECVRDLLRSSNDICIPNGDLESPC